METTDYNTYMPDKYLKLGVRVLCEKEESNLCEWNNLPQILTVERSNDMYQFLKLKQIWEIIKC